MTGDSANIVVFFFSSRRRHTRFDCDWSSDVCSSDLDGRRAEDRSDAHEQAWRSAAQTDHDSIDHDRKKVTTDKSQLTSEDACFMLLEIGRASCRERV